MVEESQVSPSSEEEEEEDGGHHLALEQRGVGDDPLSDIDRDLEELVIPDAEEDDEEQPRPKPQGGGAKVDDVIESKPWRQGSQEVYEQQLELLQGHLTTAMMQNQNLQGIIWVNSEVRLEY